MMIKTMAGDLKEDGILCALFHPGHLKTDMGGPLASTPVGVGAIGMLHTMASFTEQHTGTFHDHDGKVFPW